LDRILSGRYEAVGEDRLMMNDGKYDSAAISLKGLLRRGQQTNSTLLNQMEALFHTLGSDENKAGGHRTVEVVAILREASDTIERESTLIQCFIADLSDASVAI